MGAGVLSLKIYNQYLQTQALVSPLKSFSNSLCSTTNPPKQSYSHPQRCWSGNGSASIQASKHWSESVYNQFKTTNLRQHHNQQ